MLLEVGKRLATSIRASDTAARFGGDEFAVLLEGVNDSAMAADAAARILHALELAYEIDGKQVFPRASVGICLVDREDAVPEAAELLRNADVAMYMAKRDSKGSYRVFEPAMHERVVERLELRAELQQSIGSDQLELHYQPVVRLEGHEIVGVQSRFERDQPLTISVNLSVRQLQSDSIVADVRCALETSGLPPESLVLEITESVMMSDTDFAVQRLDDLKALGVRLAMDDFGTGYSSLSYLSRFPVDILKMDRSFVGAGENVALQSSAATSSPSWSRRCSAPRRPSTSPSACTARWSSGSRCAPTCSARSRPASSRCTTSP